MLAPTWSTFAITPRIRRLSRRRDIAGKPWPRRALLPNYGWPIGRSTHLNTERTEFSTQFSTHVHPAIKISTRYVRLAADHQPAAPPPQILDGLDRLSRVVSRARPVGPDPVRQLCPRSCRQARPRLPQHHDEPVVSAAPSDPPGAAPPGRAGIHYHPPGLPARHLHRRCADRTRRRYHPDRRSVEAGRGALR